jgi:hypothetical protein
MWKKSIQVKKNTLQHQNLDIVCFSQFSPENYLSLRIVSSVYLDSLWARGKTPMPHEGAGFFEYLKKDVSDELQVLI